MALENGGIGDNPARPELQRLNTQQIHQVAGAFSAGCSGVLNMKLALYAVDTVPALCCLYAAKTHWDSECNFPLKWFLALEGIVGLLGLIAVAIHTQIVDKVQLEDTEFTEYAFRKSQDPTINEPAMEERLKEMQEGDVYTRYVQPLLYLSSLALLIWGITVYLQTTKKTCDEALRHWTLAMLIYRVASPCVFCCCGMPLLMCCGLTAAVASGGLDDLEVGEITDPAAPLVVASAQDNSGQPPTSTPAPATAGNDNSTPLVRAEE